MSLSGTADLLFTKASCQCFKNIKKHLVAQVLPSSEFEEMKMYRLNNNVELVLLVIILFLLRIIALPRPY